MRRLFAALALAAGSAAMLAMTVASAEAQSRKKNPRQLTITQRSFLDNGKYPPVGSTRRYVTMFSDHNYLPYHDHRSRYGLETLPGRFGPWSPN